MSLQLKSKFQKQLNYLLDTENTSELDFQEFIDQNISHQDEVFHELNVPIFEQVINEKLDELKSNTNQKQVDVNRSVGTKEHHDIVNRQENEWDSEDSSSTTGDEEEEDSIENLAQSVIYFSKDFLTSIREALTKDISYQKLSPNTYGPLLRRISAYTVIKNARKKTRSIAFHKFVILPVSFFP